MQIYSEEDEKKFKEISSELHKPARRYYPRRKIIPHFIDETWSSDLIDMRKFTDKNKGYNYIMTVYDNFSKYAWAVPLKNKTAKTLREAFEKITIRRIPNRIPKYLWFDQESGIYSKEFNKFLKEADVKLYSTDGDLKAVFAERFNRTLENKLYPHMTARGENIWYDVLQNYITEYNNTKHSTIKMTPNEGSLPENSSKILNILMTDKRKFKPPKLRVGDFVRISKLKSIFGRGYTINWSYEIFQVIEVKNTKPVTYVIKDKNGEIMKASWYEQELQKSKFNFDNEYI